MVIEKGNNKMKTMITTAIAGILLATSALAAPMASEGLKTLAETGWATKMAAEGKGTSYDHTGKDGIIFSYTVDTPWQKDARALLEPGEFLAPHFLKSFDGKIYVMVAPHLYGMDGVMKGANMNKDHFIVIDGMKATRYDYSADVEGMMEMMGDGMMDKMMETMGMDKTMDMMKDKAMDKMDMMKDKAMDKMGMK